MDTNIDVSRAFRRSLLRAIVAAFFLMSCVAVAAQPSAEPFDVNFPDPKLEGAMRSILQKPDGPITSADLEDLTSLNLENNGIEVLEGLQFCGNLREIYLNGNNLRSMSPLYEIEGLVIHLDIDFPNKNIEGAVRDAIGKPEGPIQPADLRGLSRLEVDASESYCTVECGTDCPRLSGLQYCTDLTYLSLYPGMDSCLSWFTDIWPLAELTNLTELHLGLASVISLEPLSDLTNLEVLDVYITHHYWLNDLNFLRKMSKLRELYLVIGFGEGTSLDALSGMTSLEVLDLRSRSYIADITPLAGLENLRVLRFPDNLLQDITPLSGLTNLTVLDLGAYEENSWSDISDLSPLANMRELTILNLAGMKITDLSPLAGLSKLQQLTLFETGNRSIDIVKTLPALTSLTLRANWALTDIRPLVDLPNLETLRLSQFHGSDISPIAQLKGLKSLTVSPDQHLHAPLSYFTPISSLTDLEELDLDGSRITDLTILWPLEKLTTLGLNNNYLTDISALARMKSLTSLSLSSNRITDFSPLAELGELEYLNLDSNPSKDMTFASNLLNLRELSFLGGNEVPDLGPLMNLPNLEKIQFYCREPAPEPLASQLAELYARGVEVPWRPPGTDTSEDPQFAQ